MDPLSISAAVIAVATLAAQVTKAFHRLRLDYNELPGRVLALKNEVADLELVLANIHAVVEERPNWSKEEQTALPCLLERAEVRLHHLCDIIDRLVSRDNSSQVLRRATVWRRWQPKLQELQNDLRDIKASLNVLLGASNSRDMLRIRLDLEDLSRTTSNESDEQSEFREKVTADLALHHSSLTGVVNNLGTNIEQRLSNIESLLNQHYSGLPLGNQEMANVVNPQTAIDALSSPPPYAKNPKVNMEQQCEPLRLQMCKQIGPGCPPECICACHTERKSDNRGYLDRLVGRLFLSYVGVPLLSNKCDHEKCLKLQNTSLSVEYWFPLGFCWSQILHVDLAYHKNLGPQWQLKTMRQVQDSALCVKYALEGNIEGLKGLFQNGLASPRDVSSTRGYTLLRWALYGQKYQACRFLMAAGSDPDYKPIAVSDDCPSDKACDIILRGNIPREVEEIMRLISHGNDFVDNQNFSKLHKIVLGLSFSDLETEILRDPTQINASDALGRTPLEWAAARGDDRAVIILLSFGADPNVMDKKLNTPLTLASNQGHTTSVRLLLEAGAAPDPVLPVGVKFGTPLNCASRNAKDPMLLKILLDFDANVEACGVDGITPLLHAARSKPPSFAKLLLDYGANINVRSKDGRTPLTTAIVHNNHGVLRLLLDRWFEYTGCPRLQAPHLMELVAKHADCESISILTLAKHLKLRRDTSYVAEKAKYKAILNERLDVTEKLISGFDGLVEGLCSEQKFTQKPRWWSDPTRSNMYTFEKSDVEANVVETPDNDTPDQEFVDASENLALATDDLTTLLRRRQVVIPTLAELSL